MSTKVTKVPITSNCIWSNPTLTWKSCGGWVNLESTTSAYDSPSPVNVKSYATPFINDTSILAISSHNGSLWSKTRTRHWKFGLIQIDSTTGTKPSLCTTSQPSPLCPKPRTDSPTPISLAPSPSMSIAFSNSPVPSKEIMSPVNVP